MSHQTPDSSKATAQNAATEPQLPNDQARGQTRKAEPRAYAAPSAEDASLAPPAAGEVGDYADEGEALDTDGTQQGRNHANRPHRSEAERGQGRLTREANHEQWRSGLSDLGKA